MRVDFRKVAMGLVGYSSARLDSSPKGCIFVRWRRGRKTRERNWVGDLIRTACIFNLARIYMLALAELFFLLSRFASGVVAE